jgi:hypothetical protein
LIFFLNFPDVPEAVVQVEAEKSGDDVSKSVNPVAAK